MKAKTGSRTCEVEMISKDGNRVEITVDGKLYDIDVVMSENGFCSILHGGRSYNAESVRHSEGKYTITTNFRYFDIELSNPQKKYLRGRQQTMEEVQETITSPMPGKIVRIMVSEEMEVKQGDPLIVVEAMKMQSTYTAAQNAIVEKIHVEEGDSVTRDQLLISFKTN
ncbi:MAG: acetyl-CoA carboxylase biotin carboxyl carrier protein subunit [Bacteroidetes bacterium GWD2_45_23]|jgi:acetyl/propionyl-CoA carboxylase alpha subunit|nr:MAG: acetyl-CoA carboxylase biotin carboxyl carrier protein subunit [Bacteroidetes bacterium GWC2_46_850]OFX86458.1 MAG: acetyl-CoA carboxylase biotin carboxyl carrier protein subunit [Bacteroidetes bacterium GWD2_45_23]HAR38938.1 acetyl-CoA carboxylase biotin carboxyl carrier protein subunit [Porphyromonadaceae bacterium]HBB00017.1 acetyl-CoA carboxylase biotin carboxyl carrier protein subunit [Porphyromonadaceae bacterium]HCC16950.1 acetyl-CoA carboxylase biotin carboxyl carrier protein su